MTDRYRGLGDIVARPTSFPAPAVARTAPLGTKKKPLPLIIDSDPGLDDALAIGLACARPELNLLAVTTVGGNADGVKRLLGLAGISLPARRAGKSGPQLTRPSQPSRPGASSR